MEFYVSELPDGRLNMREVFMTGGENPARITPRIRGDIEAEPALYHILPVKTFLTGDIMKDEEERWELEHVVFTRIAHKTEDSVELDFESVYCFDCARQEFYRVEPLVAWKDVEEPLLRFKPQERVFIIDDVKMAPPPHLIAEEKELQEYGVDKSLDPELQEAIAQYKAMQSDGQDNADEAVEVLEADDIDDEFMIEADEENVEDTPDVPAVDLA